MAAAVVGAEIPARLILNIFTPAAAPATLVLVAAADDVSHVDATPGEARVLLVCREIILCGNLVAATSKILVPLLSLGPRLSFTSLFSYGGHMLARIFARVGSRKA